VIARTPSDLRTPVGAVYRDWANRRWVDWKRGSGCFVRPRVSEKKTFDPDLDLEG